MNGDIGKCALCGKEYIKNGRKLYCSNICCKRAQGRRRMEIDRASYLLAEGDYFESEAERREANRPSLTLAQAYIQSKRLGMDYGEYIAMIEGRKNGQRKSVN